MWTVRKYVSQIANPQICGNSANVPLCGLVCDLKTQAIFADLKLPQVRKYILVLHKNVTNNAPIQI